MNWKFWQKKKNPQPVDALVDGAIPPLVVSDYSPKDYRVYWETHLDQVADGTWTAEVRFVGWGGFAHRSSHNLYGPTKTNVEYLVNKLVTETMETFRK